MSPMTEINLAFPQTVLIMLSGHTSCAPKIPNVGCSCIYFSLSSSSFSFIVSVSASVTLLTATRLFFLTVFPTCRTSNLPPSKKAVGLETIPQQTMQHKGLRGAEPPIALTIAIRKQFSLSVQKDFSVASRILAVSVVTSR